MSLEFDVCTPDMNECTRKCRFGSNKATDCLAPCTCYGDRFYHLDRFRGKCVETAESEQSCLDIPSGSGIGGGSGGGTYCPNGGTWVAVCTNENVIGCGRYPDVDGCYTFCGPAGKSSSSIYNTVDIEGYGNCSTPVLVYGLKSIELVFSPPATPGPFLPNYPFFDHNRDTCGASYNASVIALSENGPIYINYYYRLIYVTPLTTLEELTSVNGLIFVEADVGVNGSCQTCGNDGQPPCPLGEDLTTKKCAAT